MLVAGDIRDTSLNPGLGKSSGGGYGNPLQYSCLGKSHGQRSLKGYKSMGHKRVRHNLVSIQQQQKIVGFKNQCKSFQKH